MGKEDILTFAGEIVECLPLGRCRVRLENDHVRIGTLACKLRKFQIRVIMGDRVDVEMTPYDLERGRIVYRHR